MNAVLPYVYKLTHKITNQYYFGFRCANKLPANLDLGHHYFSSSKSIKELGFENFYIQIIQEFESKQDAFLFESELINSYINDPLNLNKALNGKLNPIRKHTTQQHRDNLSKALKGKSPKNKRDNTKLKEKISQMSPEERSMKYASGRKKAHETVLAMSPEERSIKFGTMKNRTHSEQTRLTLSSKLTGKRHSTETKIKMSQAGKGRKQSASTVLARSKKFAGGGNPRAIPVTVMGINYTCKKDARLALGWSKNKLNEYLISH